MKKMHIEMMIIFQRLKYSMFPGICHGLSVKSALKTKKLSKISK